MYNACKVVFLGPSGRFLGLYNIRWIDIQIRYTAGHQALLDIYKIYFFHNDFRIWTRQGLWQFSSLFPIEVWNKVFFFIFGCNMQYAKYKALRTCSEYQVFREKTIKFATAVDLKQCLQISDITCFITFLSYHLIQVPCIQTSPFTKLQ